MVNTELDFDVWQALQAARQSEVDSVSAVIRRLMDIAPPPPQQRSWTSPDGKASLDHGTVLQAIYKGKTYLAQVVEGAIELDGTRFPSLSAAAKSVTERQANGWTFWKYQPKGKKAWVQVDELRK